MPIDLFEQEGISPYEQDEHDLFQQQNINIPNQQGFAQQHPLLQNLYNIGGGLVQGAINVPGELFNLANKARMLSATGEKLPITAPHLEMPGIEQNALSSKISEFIGGLASPFGGLSITSGLAKSGLKLGSKLTGHEANKLSESLYKNLAGNMDKKELNDLVANHVLQNLDKNMKIGSEKFNNFLNESEKSGYLPEAHQGIPGISMPSASKFIKPTNELTNHLDEISNIKGIDKSTLDAIKAFKNNPSIHNTHELQSKLFKEKQGWMKPEDRTTRALLDNTRNQALNSVEKTLKENKDEHLLEMFKDARENWRKTVVPYMNDAAIRRAATGGALPKNIASILEKQNKSGGYDLIRKDLASNPEQSKSLFAYALSKGIEKDTKGNAILSAEKALKNYSGLSNTLRDLLMPNMKDYMKKIEKSKKASEAFNKMTVLPKLYKKYVL